MHCMGVISRAAAETADVETFKLCLIVFKSKKDIIRTSVTIVSCVKTVINNSLSN